MKGITISAPTASRPMLRFSDAISVVRSRVASSNPQVANPASWNSDSNTKIERGETLQPKRTAETKPDAAENDHDLERPGRMASQDALGDDQRAERDQGRRNQ